MDDRLESAGASAVHAAARSAGDVVAELTDVSDRARRSRRRHRASVLALPVAVVAAVVALVASGVFAPSSPPTVRVTMGAGQAVVPGSSSPAAVDGPAGWQSGDTGKARVWVPAGWTVLATDDLDLVCPSTGGELQVDGVSPATTPVCGALTRTDGPTVTLLAADGDPHAVVTSSATVNGYEVDAVTDAPPGGEAYVIPQLGVRLTITGTDPAPILATIGPSPAGRVLLGGLHATVPAGWQTIEYGGIHVQVPPSWPTLPASDNVSCQASFARADVAYLGGDTPHTCESITPDYRAALIDGLLVEPALCCGSFLPHPSVGTIQGATIAQSDAGGSAILIVYFSSVTVEVGIGPDPDVARTILSSITSSVAPAHAPA